MAARPPRGAPELVDGEPVYGPRDRVDLEKVRELGLPFWLAGGQATPQQLRLAQEAGAVGIQAGTVFAFCEESGMAPEIRAKVLDQVRGRPRHGVHRPARLADRVPLQGRESRGHALGGGGRPRGASAAAIWATSGSPTSPPTDVSATAARPSRSRTTSARAATFADTVGRKCICNGLTATIGLGQRRHGNEEEPIVTAGNDLEELGDLLGPDHQVVCGRRRGRLPPRRMSPSGADGPA